MHLRSLTLRGFKSFAASTTLRFEPGITAVVGPNGSGKSNVVDAIAWVLGEQGAKSLRGGKMEDVIFAGTPSRPPLGRAEVVLSIDNSDGALPIDYAEVTVSRLMYRSGSSEYAINGTPCRLLDVQELLSDSGVGRELHVIIGQGQLEAVLQSRPEDRRAFIEEAAGVLKHRRRKEKALRKLDAMQANLTRLTDLTAELRRQLGPLGRQAEVARRAGLVQAELRDARLRLLADDVLRLRTELETDQADETAARTRRAAVEAGLAEATEQEARLDEATAAAAPRLSAVTHGWYRLAAVAERLRGTARLAEERSRHLADPGPPPVGPDPDDIAAQALRVREEERVITAALAEDRDRLAAATAGRAALESALADAERRIVTAARAVADRREGLARLAGELAAARSREAATGEEADRLAVAECDARERRAASEAAFAAAEGEAAGLGAGEVDLDTNHAGAQAAYDATARRLATFEDEERAVERERAALAARREALALALAGRDGDDVLSAEPPAGLLGPLAALVRIEAGFETAVSAALGDVANGLVLESLDSAVAAARTVRARAGGRVALLVSAPPRLPVRASTPDGARAAGDLVSGAEPVRTALSELLADVVVVDDLPAAHRLLTGSPGLRVVTRDGDVVTSRTVRVGVAGERSRLELQTAFDATQRAIDEATRRAERLRFTLASAREDHAEAGRRVEAALARLHESDAQLAAVAERLGGLAAAARAAAAEADRLAAARDRILARRQQEATALAELAARHAAALAAPDESEPDPAERDRLATEVAGARQVELDARLAVRTGEERVRALSGRADALDAAASAGRVARAEAARLAGERAQQARVARAVARAAGVILERVESAQAAAAAERARAEAEQAARERDVAAARSRLRELGAELEALTDAVHRDEVVRAEMRLRIEQLEARASEEYGVPPDTLLADYGPDVAVPGDEGTPERPYDREEQDRRLASAERALAKLGRVNPLALEEYAALEERHVFLAAALEDLKKTRRDLLTVVREVDERVEEVFAAAFADTAREFETVFGTLFPGGRGQLLLTDPSDLLTSGIEIEARPAGKKVNRLSLLSGGERSLTAIALLVAIFRARPSPFYVLDEVEAALDDRNLGRLLGLLDELRSTSQLIVVTHQKRSMEIADALYGVSMRSDGVSAVISQRLRESVAASAAG